MTLLPFTNLDRIGARTSSKDGANGVHRVLDARFAVDGKPAFQCDRQRLPVWLRPITTGWW